MSLAFLLPAGLAALAALVVPLLLHLARRHEQTPTDFAALRWLRQKPKPRHRIRFDEWPLLLVRLQAALKREFGQEIALVDDSLAPRVMAYEVASTGSNFGLIGALSLTYANNNAWFGQPDQMLAGNPLVQAILDAFPGSTVRVTVKHEQIPIEAYADAIRDSDEDDE